MMQTSNRTTNPKTTATITPEAGERGLSWEKQSDAETRRLPNGVLWSADGPFASVAMEQSDNGLVAEVGTFGADRGDLRDSYPTMTDGITAAESWAVQRLETEATLSKHTDAAIAPWAEASESYYAKLSALAESRARTWNGALATPSIWIASANELFC